VCFCADGEGPHAVPTKKFSKLFANIAEGNLGKTSGQILGNKEAVEKYA
jgi:hypothetical protein